MMNAKRLAQYLAGEAMDADVSSLKTDLAEHRKVCEAKPGNCPKEKALRQEIEKAEGPKDEADNAEGARRRTTQDVPVCQSGHEVRDENDDGESAGGSRTRLYG